MQQAPPKAPALSGNSNLPSFQDRLPDLILAIRGTAQDLSQAKENESYLPYWEDLYAVLHNAKGVLTLLQTPKELADFILKFCDTLNLALIGPLLLRNKKEAGRILSDIAEQLEHPELKPYEGAGLIKKLDHLAEILIRDLDHTERLKSMPTHLFYVSDLVSKKARELALLHLNDCVVEDMILLDQIPFWRAQLQDALLFHEFGRGLVVNFLPFLSPEGSRTIRVWAWVAAASSSRATLKQRIKDIMPKVNITKV